MSPGHVPLVTGPRLRCLLRIGLVELALGGKQPIPLRWLPVKP
ncbi:hypothetical protein ACP26L_29775 [Paenibacillus sp. S-38]